MDKSIHFLLVPDKYAARRVRRLIAENGGRLGVMVGTWLELLTLAKENYLIPDRDERWNSVLSTAMAVMPEAFWAASFLVAPNETLASVSQALLALVEGMELGQRLGDCDPSPLPCRARNHFSALADLQDALGGELPPSLQAIKEILAAGKPLKRIKIYHLPGFPVMNRWQEALLARLACDAEDCCTDDNFQAYLAAALAWSPLAHKGTALHQVQHNLFSDSPGKANLDTSLQWIACRDFREEVEIAVSMIQQLLVADETLSLAEIGIMLPRDAAYAHTLKDVAGLAGLALSGLSIDLAARDLGREVMMLFISTRRQPAPIMALAALLSHPLQPWSTEQGMTLAQAIMKGKFDYKPVPGMDYSGRRMLALISRKTESVAELKNSLAEFAELLVASENLKIHLSIAREVAADIRSNLNDAGEPPWQILINICSPQPSNIPEATEDLLEGLCVFQESAEPWRQLRHLYVLGFSSGSYPSEPSASAVFSEADMVALKVGLQIKIETTDDLLSRRRGLLKRQIGAVSERINFFSPCRDYFGAELTASSSLTFMAMLIEGAKEPEELLLNLDREADRCKVLGLPEVYSLAAVSPREIIKADFDLGFDLMTIGQKENGELKTQSPSSLGTLMTSPLAWLFNRSGIEPREWQPESLDIMTKGTLAHAVFEYLFPEGSSFPNHQEIAERVPGLLSQAINSNCPFLRTPEWHVERHHLEREIIIAAEAWTDMLTGMGARVIGTELGLQGEFEGLPIYGRADLIIALPGERALVIDLKKSNSKGRRAQMVKGYDSQAELYRRMLNTGGFTDEKQQLPQDIEIGVMYYLMNDQVALTDSRGWFIEPIMGLNELGAGISLHGVALIKQKIAEVRMGKVGLNRDTDVKWFEKNAGIKIYALTNSPLLGMFMLPGEEEDNAIA
ncbi:MAG: PD-(D/E)XK nuclease family protein [Desulfobulbaceae bacterium]|nr:PD-(D/E)XK nuclease family protein [Desulfobulbaceae bacterium]